MGGTAREARGSATAKIQKQFGHRPGGQAAGKVESEHDDMGDQVGSFGQSVAQQRADYIEEQEQASTDH